MKRTRLMLPGLLCLFMVACNVVDAVAQTPWTTSRLKGTPTPPPAFRVQRAFAQQAFTNPTSILEIASSGEILVTQMNGQIYSFAKSAHSADKHTVANLAEIAGGDVNLFSAALHPEFTSNGQLYVCLVHPEGGRHTRVSRFATNKDAAGRLTVDGNSEQVIIKWPSGGHNGGCLRFGPDGLLYISTGDGAGPNPPDGLTTGQDVTDLLGAILRIDVDQHSDDQNYGIPAGNPFVGSNTARPEIFGYGLRNPWKFNIDSQSGDVFVADNGWETWEMVHHVKSGQNCGWPVMEGRAPLRTEVKVGPTPIVPPARDHHHSEANSVIGGPVYHGEKHSALDGVFVYGDYITGTIWGLKPDGDDYLYVNVVDTDLRIVDFTQGSDGELYVLDYDYTGGIYEIVPNNVDDLSEQFPKRLSETGLFESLRDLQPADGVTEYDVVAPRWHDGAVARRWVAVPLSGVIGDQVQSNLSSPYPDGTVLVKHLSLASNKATPLETQILHYENSRWNPYSYLWNDEGTDADLVDSVGANKQVMWREENGTASERTWRASATNECRLCHNAGSHFVLGFTPEQLQKKTGAAADSITFEASLRQAGLFQTKATPNPAAMLVDPHDTDHSLDDRARSYLHANCSMCHHKGGNAIISFYLRRDLPFAELKTNKGTGIGTFGMRNARIIVPGDPWRSVLMYRMSKLGYARMPYIGSQVVDSDGVALISSWIRSLSVERSAATSPPLVDGAPEATALQTLADSKSPTDRAAAVTTLAASTEGSLALVAGFHAGAFTAADRDVATTIAKNSGSDIRGLFDHFIPEAERKQTLGRTFDAQVVLSRTGDARRGKLVFATNDARCRKCHDVSESRKSIGPTLTEISKKYPRRSELLLHVMKPSQKIDDKFAAWAVVTSAGRIVTGLREPSTKDSISLQTSDGKLVTLRNDEIDEQQQSKVSLMPEGVLADMTAQEAADLLAYIQSITPDDSVRSTPYGGKPHAIPGKIEAEHYDDGAAGVAYHDVDPTNLGVDYRRGTQVDIEQRDDASNGHGIGWTRKGEWFVYTVNVAKDGQYSVQMPVASNKQGGIFHMEVDGQDISGPIRIPDTGGWQKLQHLKHSGISLTKGVQTIRMVMDEQGPSGSIGDIDYFRFTLLD